MPRTRVEVAADKRVPPLCEGLKRLRSWRNEGGFLSGQKFEVIDRLVASFEASPELYEDLDTTREELEWLRRQEKLREGRRLVALMREQQFPDSCNLMPTIRRLRDLCGPLPDEFLVEVGTHESELYAKERAYRAAGAKKLVEALREEVYFSWMSLEEFDRRFKQIRTLLDTDGCPSHAIEPEEIGTTEHELSSLRKPVLVREARDLLDQIGDAIQFDHRVGDRFARLEKLLERLEASSRVVGVTPERFERLRESVIRSNNRFR